MQAHRDNKTKLHKIITQVRAEMPLLEAERA
jgi:hypothetical protein